MGNGTNNNVGRNESPKTLQEDIHFDLASVGGTDTLGTRTGKLYTTTDLAAIAVARGAKYEDGSLFAATDSIIDIEVDLKPLNGQGFNEGDETQEVIATTSDAAYKNNGGWTDIDPSGGRDEADETNSIPSSVEELFVAEGSVLTVHLKFQKA